MTNPTFPPIVPPDDAARSRARELRAALPASLGTPPQSLGRLEDIGAWIAACQGEPAPRPLESPRLLIISGDNPIASAVPEISALPQDYTSAVSASIRQGDAPIVDACRRVGSKLSPIDATTDQTLGAIDREDAMSADTYAELLKAGQQRADQEADSGTDVILLGDLGRGLTTVAAAMIGSVCGIEPVKIIGRGSGIGDEAWKAKCAAIRDAMYRVRDDRAVAERVLRRVGSANLVVSAGLLAQAAVRRTPVIFDGVGITAAALCAQMLAPGANAWWMAASVGDEPAHLPALRALGLTPVLDMKIGTGQGLGAVLALPMVQHAVEVYSASTSV
ncbi:nicotinate-nucleotide--dimethylbenzimidazole phosphoribosyltransferase [Corynebacterium falsenii]|uniref:nicotinate-nucleotide--dimethylbenzimidazole phosphoribosyltransferase n=1 Tax=Corynebacterium falsenii TaxID=108486 RepID=UPI003FD2E948